MSKLDAQSDHGQLLSPTPWRSTDPWATQAKPPGAYPPSPVSSHVDVSALQSLSGAVKARKAEYVRKRSIKIKVGTWNVASISGTEKDLGAWFVQGLGAKGLSQDLSGLNDDSHDDDDSDSDHNMESVESQEARVAKKKTTVPQGDVAAAPSGDEIDLYVLGLQEVVDVSSMTEAIRPYTDPNPGKKWKRALKRSLPPGYTKIAEEQLLGLLLLIYASPTVAPSISSVSTTSVGTGLMGYLGNKGAVAARIVLGETTRLCFVNSHLAAGADQTALTRRIWDTNQILSRTRFSPASSDGEVGGDKMEEKIGDEDFAFWFGDLNYRLEDIPGEDVRRLLLLHTRNEYDIENKSKRRIDSELGYVNPLPGDPAPSQPRHYEYGDGERPATESRAQPPLDPKSDPASLHITLQSLLAHDQLRIQQKLGKAFHDGWREGEINFLPTYKYDVGSVGMFDSGEKKRSPSWCDRILFRTRQDRQTYEEKARQREEARKKDASMKARGIDQATAEHDILFDYDPDTDGDGLAYGDDYEDYDEQEDACHDAELVRTHDEYGDGIKVDSYISHQRILSSDHKPLDATFTLIYDAVIPELKAKVHQEVARELDKAENEGRPAVTVVVDTPPADPGRNADGAAEDVNVVHFGDVRYGVRKSRTVTVANTGQISARFSFVERPAEPDQDPRIMPDWLELRVDMEGEVVREGDTKTGAMTLSPGESASIELTVDITDGQLVHSLNDGVVELDDILVLSVENGRDHFVPLKGRWLRTCFFQSLDELVAAPEGGVRQIQGQPYTHGGGHHHSAPKELYALTEVLPVHLERSIAEWGMVHDGETPPWQYEAVGVAWPFDRHTWTFHAGEERDELLAGVREALDTGRPLEGDHFGVDVPCVVRLEILAETFVSFVASLRDGVVPADGWAEVEERLTASKNLAGPEEIREMVMDCLSRSPIHNVSFTFVTFLLVRMVHELVACGAGAAGGDRTMSTTVSDAASRRSRTSTVSSDSGQPLSGTSQTPPAAAKRGLLAGLPLRRRRTQSISSSSTTATTPDPEAVAQSERRRKIVAAYVDVFAPVVIRSAADESARGKEKKARDAHKRVVLEAFLDGKHL